MNKLLIVALALTLVLSIACTKTVIVGTGSGVNMPEPMDEDPTTEVQEISMNMIQGDFEPGIITVKKDIQVKLTITATEIDPEFTEHMFAIKEFGINEIIVIGETKEIVFTPNKAGSFVFYCGQFCGEGHIGQTGIMHVVE